MALGFQERQLLKFECIERYTTSEELSVTAGGFEYMLYGVGGSAIDGGLLAEGLFDLQGRRALPPFKRDF